MKRILFLSLLTFTLVVEVGLAKAAWPTMEGGVRLPVATDMQSLRLQATWPYPVCLAPASCRFVNALSGNFATGSTLGALVALQSYSLGYLATVGGGYQNDASGSYSTIGGGYQNKASDNSATVAGGAYNEAAAYRATVGGGYKNEATDTAATVSGGSENKARGSYAVIAGGTENEANSDADYAVIGGGDRNKVQDSYATIGGGVANIVSGSNSTIGGGYLNKASGNYATVPGGTGNEAGGNYSFAAGRRARAYNDGSFVWADSTDANFSDGGANRFKVRATGGVYLYTGVDPSYVGAKLASGSSQWTTLCDRSVKRNIRPVDGKEILAKLIQVQVSRWGYITQDPGIDHISPMAQDFYAAFGLGEDDRHIGTLDISGVALASIQGLHKLLEEKDAQIAAQQQQIDTLEARLAALEALLKPRMQE